MSVFHDERFPDRISRGARGGPRRRVEIVTLQSGHEERNASWSASRRSYDVAFGLRSNDDLQRVVTFFEAVGGQLHGFRFKDWSDYKSSPVPSRVITSRDQIIGTGDASTQTFQLVKTYASGSLEYRRTITRPVAGKTVVALNDEEQVGGFSVDHTTGLVTFDVPPAAGVVVSAGFEFDVPARFDTDALDVTLDIERTGSISSIPIIEIRDQRPSL